MNAAVIDAYNAAARTRGLAADAVRTAEKALREAREVLALADQTQDALAVILREQHQESSTSTLSFTDDVR